MLFLQVLNPLYWIQAGSITLWLCYGYIEYSLVIIIITIISIVATVYDLRKVSVLEYYVTCTLIFK